LFSGTSIVPESNLFLPGAVPTDYEGLLPFLAAEVLRGRKVILFPEGGMVKDRRVLDRSGGYSIYSRSTLERRKQHTGAAVVALDGCDLVRVLDEPRLAGGDPLRDLHVQLARGLAVGAAGLRIAVVIQEIAGAEGLRAAGLARTDVDANGGQRRPGGQRAGGLQAVAAGDRVLLGV
jgi:hypothetical protein